MSNFLSRAELEEISEGLIRVYATKHRNKVVQSIDIELYSRVADDRKDILIETKDGLRFTIQYYPSYGWINITKTLSYYQMSSEIKEWFEVNIK